MIETLNDTLIIKNKDYKIKIDSQQIARRQIHLQEVSKKLKEKFVGIDQVIDKIINQIHTWYIIPDILMRPVVICLWGITGIGKTDLVRTLVKQLHLLNNYMQIQMGSIYNKDNLQWYLESTGMNHNDRNILLLDEIQRYRTVDQENKELRGFAFSGDIWELLSDGKFNFDTKIRQNLVWTIKQIQDWIEYNDPNNPEEDGVNDEPATEVKKINKNQNKLSSYLTRRVMQHLRHKYTNSYIKSLTIEEILNELYANLQNQNQYQPTTYNKLLIIISGNLDDAYPFSGQVSEADIDPDIIYRESKKVNIIDVKDVLLRRFKPEQIARLGNNHIIYPTLSSAAYRNLTEKKLQQISENIFDKTSVQIKWDESISQVILKNGVFPAQGVRPLFSAMSMIIQSNLPIFIQNALKYNVFNFTLYYKQNKIYSHISSQLIEQPVWEILQQIRTKKNKNINNKRLVAVHQTGHALLYAILYNQAPSQININSTSNFNQGFVLTEEIHHSKSQLLNQIAVLMAGRAAQIVVFGEDSITAGARADISIASSIAGRLCKKYGMNHTISEFISQGIGHDVVCATDDMYHNNNIQEIVTKGLHRSIGILNQHRQLFIKIVQNVFDQGNIQPQKFIQICKEVSPTYNFKISDEVIIMDYNQMWNNFNKGRQIIDRHIQ